MPLVQSAQNNSHQCPLPRDSVLHASYFAGSLVKHCCVCHLGHLGTGLASDPAQVGEQRWRHTHSGISPGCRGTRCQLGRLLPLVEHIFKAPGQRDSYYLRFSTEGKEDQGGDTFRPKVALLHQTGCPTISFSGDTLRAAPMSRYSLASAPHHLSSPLDHW